MKNARAEVGRGHLRDRESGVLEQGPVAVEGLPIRTQDGNRLGNGVDNLLRLLLGRPESFHSSNATPRLPDRNVGFAAVRFHLPPVRLRLAAARFHLRPVRPELSDISLPLAGVRVWLPAVRALVPTVRRPLAGVRRRLPPARASVPMVSRPLAGVRGRLPPARARVPTVSLPLAGVRDRLPPARASVPTVSRPLLAMRGLHPAYDGTGRDHEPTALERAGAPPDDAWSSLDEQRAATRKATVRARVFVLARGQNRARETSFHCETCWPDYRTGRRGSGDVNVQRHEARHRAERRREVRMNATLRRRLERAVRVRDFIRAHRTDGAGEATALTRLE